MVVRFSFGISQFMEKMHVCLKGVTVVWSDQSCRGGEWAMFVVWVWLWVCAWCSIFFCKPVDVVEGISLRACCSDGGVSNVGIGGGWLFSKGVGMFITNNTSMGLYFEKWMGDGDWRIALAMDWRTSPWMWWRWRFGCEISFIIWCSDVRLSGYMWVAVYDCSCYSC